MVRFVGAVSYDGTNFYGFQKQKGLRTIQEELEKTLSYLFQTDIEISASGRTDRGVHAFAHIISFKLTKCPIPPSRFLKVINDRLPQDLSLRWLYGVKDNFDPRRNAKAKHYRYLIYNDRGFPFFRNYMWIVREKLNLSLVKKGMFLLTGTKDFKGFCPSKVANEKNTIRTIFRYSYKFLDENLLAFDVWGSSFLQYQVRIMTACLVYLGLGKITFEEFRDIVERGSRPFNIPTAPPNGLYLMKVYYPENLKFIRLDNYKLDSDYRIILDETNI